MFHEVRSFLVVQCPGFRLHHTSTKSPQATQYRREKVSKRKRWGIKEKKEKKRKEREKSQTNIQTKKERTDKALIEIMIAALNRGEHPKKFTYTKRKEEKKKKERERIKTKTRIKARTKKSNQANKQSHD